MIYLGTVIRKYQKNKVAEIDTTLDKYLRARKKFKKNFFLLDSRHLIKPIDQSILDHLNEVTDKEVFLFLQKKIKLKTKVKLKKILTLKK